MKLSKPIVVQGPGRAEGKAEDQIMKPTNELSDIELRYAVAVEVMGMLRCDYSGDAREFPKCRHCGVTLYHGENPVSWCLGQEPDRYESSIEAAFEVVAKMRTILNRWGGQNRLLLEQKPDGMFKAAFYGDETNWEASAWVDAATAPRAICIAALTALRARKA